VYNIPLLEQAFDEIIAHSGEVTQVIVSPDSKFIFTTGSDGTIFIFSVHEYMNEHENFKPIGIDEDKIQTQDINTVIVDKTLADIVLVKKADMEEWRKKQELLRQEMEETSARVESTIADVKNKFKKEMTDLEISHKREKKTIEERYKTLMQEKEAHQHEYNQNIKRTELNHIEMIEELKAIFDKKSSIDNSNYLTLEQKMNEMEQGYQDQLKKQEEQNSKKNDDLQGSYKESINKITEQFEEAKKMSDGLKTMYEEKLSQQEEEHENEVAELKSDFEQVKNQLQDIIANQKSDLDTINMEKKTMAENIGDLNKENENETNKFTKLKKECTDLNAKIERQDIEKKLNQEQLKQKEHDLYKYKFKIQDLQKSKHVLTHRATEMRASLEPKEQQIESLKEQILNLDTVFDQQMKSMLESKKDLEKKQFKITQLSKELNAQKNITKEKEKTIFKIITDVHTYVQNKDEKSYAAGLMKLNQDYVRPRASELLEKKKKDPETIEELEGQLRYNERSIIQLKVNTIKNENRTRLHIKKKTSENTKLIMELNALKKDKKLLIGENKKYREEIRNIEEKMKRSRRRDDGDHGNQQASAQSLTHKYGNEDSIPSLVGGRPHSVKKQNNGKLYKGTPYQYRMTNLEDKARISELSNQIEETQQVVLIQKLEIKSLKEKFISLVNDRNRLLAQLEGSQQDVDQRQNVNISENDNGFLPRVDIKNQE
jgi:hypothetical protein